MSAKTAALYTDLPLTTFVREAKKRGLTANRIGNRTIFDRAKIDQAFFGEAEKQNKETADSWISKL